MQQINLYLPELRPKREPMRARHIGWAVLAMVLLLIPVSLWSAARTDALEEQVATATDKLQALQAQVLELQGQALAAGDVDLEAEIGRLREDIRRRERLKTLMTQQNLGNAEGFSQQMHGLARQALNDLTLEWFSLQHGGGYVELGGRVLSADLVPLYLQRLRQEPSFADTRFGVLDMGRDDAPTTGLVFELSRARAPGERGR